VFLTSSYDFIDKDEEIIQKLIEPDFDIKNRVVLETTPSINPQGGGGIATIEYYSPQEVLISTNSQVPKILYLSDNYYPGWKATVDGYKVDILNADYAFRAVPLPKGEHIVRFYYDSLAFKIGVAISLASLLLVWLLYFSKLFKKF